MTEQGSAGGVDFPFLPKGDDADVAEAIRSMRAAYGIAQCSRPTAPGALVTRYDGRKQGAQIYNPTVWVSALAGVANEGFVRCAVQGQQACDGTTAE